METLDIVLVSPPKSSSPSSSSVSSSEASSSHPSSHPSSHHEAASEKDSIAHEQPTEVGVRRRPIPRKGHKKSRNGCFNCKRRKVKCQETLPACGQCRRNGLVCEYPAAPKTVTILSPPSPSPQQPALSVFSLVDLRFFHHFLIKAYPPLPIRGDHIWKDVAQFSHGFDFLVHAMLGLAASHLTLCGGADYSSEALDHRVTAIKLLNRSLSRPCPSRTEGDARYAAMMALTFQSSYMADGMLDFLSMTRGCHIVAMSGMPCFGDSLFAGFSGEGHLTAVRGLNHPGATHPLDDGFLDGFSGSLRALAPLCHSTLEVNFLARIEKVLNTARISSLDAFGEISMLYGWAGAVEQAEFLTFVDPANHAAQLLMVHFFLLEFALACNAFGSKLDSFLYRRRMNVVWFEKVLVALPGSYKRYIEWPIEFSRLAA